MRLQHCNNNQHRKLESKAKLNLTLILKGTWAGVNDGPETVDAEAIANSDKM